ncbi:MAG: sialate O-acetylesterase [Pirellulaceae bacterium]|jgi:sialate O-acetylesterase
MGKIACYRFGIIALVVTELIMSGGIVQADITLPSMIGNHMVLQRDAKVPIWGWAKPGERISVVIDRQRHATTAGGDGSWRVDLTPLQVGEPRKMRITGNNEIELTDILVGEVWVCSGQSNMGMTVKSSWNSDLEIAAADYPQIRLVTVGNQGSQNPQKDFDGNWEICSSETVGEFSAVGYFFGRNLHQQLRVPIGLIDNAWGGSACEAWIRRDLLKANPLYEPLLLRWAATEATFDLDTEMDKYEKKVANWQEAVAKAKAAGEPIPNRPRPPRNPLTGQHRPANLFNGRIAPIVPYGIRGAVWYQGETNAGRAFQYRDMFPLMIKNWRDAWGQGDFPFYWVQLADFKPEVAEPGESEWAELREAQTISMKKVQNSGQAVIIDLGEGNDIHPKNKQEVASRLARWALARDYKLKIDYHSPQQETMQVDAGKCMVSFGHVGGGLRTIDSNEVKGFALAGADRKWYWASAKIAGKDKVEVWSDQVPEPIAVRYGWADNPVCNLYSTAGLPVTPFRSDVWPGLTFDAK